MIPSNKYSEWERLTLPSRVYFNESRTLEWEERSRSALPGISTIYWGEGVPQEYWIPFQVFSLKRYPLYVEVWRVSLWYFLIQTPMEPLPPAGTRQPITITLQDALHRVREVRYDRGQIRDTADQLALEMADTKKRIESFTRSTLYRRGYPEAFRLAHMAMFYLQDLDYPDAIRCTFCRKTFLQGHFLFHYLCVLFASNSQKFNP